MEQDADLHMAQLMPLPLTDSCFSKIQLGLTFWYWLTRVVPDKGPLNGSALVLDRVRHFRPIQIHRFFAVNRIRYRIFDTLQEWTWRRVTDRSKAPDAAAATNNSGAPQTSCIAAADAFDLLWTVKHSNYQ